MLLITMTKYASIKSYCNGKLRIMVRFGTDASYYLMYGLYITGQLTVNMKGSSHAYCE